MVKTKSSFLSWTDDEVKLLLKVTLDYKVTMAAKDQLTSKLKNIRNKYRQAVKTGQKRSHGRVILLFFELCESIWEESQGRHDISGETETVDTKPDISLPAASSAATGEESLTDETIEDCRQQLNGSLGAYRRSKLKRRPSSDVAMEDLRIKRRLLHQLEATHDEFVSSIGRLSSSVDRLNSNIELLVQHIVGSNTGTSTGNSNTEDFGHSTAGSVNVPVDQPSLPCRIKDEFVEVALDSSPGPCPGSPKLRIKSEQVEEDSTETMMCSTQTQMTF
ncbi:uncharacterized protein LOC134063762 isoform X2 [Sardina pilchardus]|uniref:uncharacterized protein LOC134063762 isoform X2 n=1 Tax=Sardina pilchardus TaxID=27697 RepID=UPI002E0D504A